MFQLIRKTTLISVLPLMFVASACQASAKKADAEASIEGIYRLQAADKDLAVLCTKETRVYFDQVESDSSPEQLVTILHVGGHILMPKTKGVRSFDDGIEGCVTQQTTKFQDIPLIYNLNNQVVCSGKIARSETRTLQFNKEHRVLTFTESVNGKAQSCQWKKVRSLK